MNMMCFPAGKILGMSWATVERGSGKIVYVYQ